MSQKDLESLLKKFAELEHSPGNNISSLKNSLTTGSQYSKDDNEDLDDQRYKVIIGVDYGTTYSGVSYATSDKKRAEDIVIIDSWPGQSKTAWKIPTSIAYQRENPDLESDVWGSEVEAGMVSYTWTKLLLDKHARHGKFDDPALKRLHGTGLMSLPKHRDAQGVCEDYLRHLYAHVKSILERQMTPETFQVTPMECWITLPAIWSDSAKSSTLAAAKAAGFGSRHFDQIYSISEPEAAALTALRSYSGETPNKVMNGEHILICDCGGGTVDITTYTISQTEPRLEFEELLTGIGGKCGSTYIDRNLHALLSRRFGKAFDDLPQKVKGPGSKLMRSFEGVKSNFGFEGTRRGTKDIGPINLKIDDSEYYDSEDRQIKLSRDDLLDLFKPVVLEIQQLVAKQVSTAKEQKKVKIDRVILVGGFGDSHYLANVLRNWCRINGGIRLMVVDNPQAAIVKGATLRGLDGTAPKLRKARRHYGYAVSLVFREGVDPASKGYIDQYYQQKYCDGRMAWLIHKNEDVFRNTFRESEIWIEYGIGDALSCTTTLYSCGDDVAPEYLDHPSIETVGEIHCDFSKNFKLEECETRWNDKLKKNVYQFSQSIQIKFGQKEGLLNVQSKNKRGDVVGTAEILYSH